MARRPAKKPAHRIKAVKERSSLTGKKHRVTVQTRGGRPTVKQPSTRRVIVQLPPEPKTPGKKRAVKKTPLKKKQATRKKSRLKEKKGGKKMPGRPKRRPTIPIEIPGQKRQFRVRGSRYGIERQQDIFQIKKPPKKPKIKWV